MVFLGNIFRGGKPMFREIEGMSRLELKYIKCTLLLHAPLKHMKIALESPEALLSDEEFEQIVNVWIRRVAV